MQTKTMPGLLPVRSAQDIPSHLIGTPFEKLLRFSNLNEEFDVEVYEKPELLIVKCMDHRKHLRFPERFAYIVRNAGGNVRSNEFSMAFAIGVGNVTHVAIIGHTDCGMENLALKRDKFVQGMVENAGWGLQYAETFFHMRSPDFGIYDPALFALMESQRFQGTYPKIKFQPFLYNVEDGELYVIEVAHR